MRVSACVCVCVITLMVGFVTGGFECVFCRYCSAEFVYAFSGNEMQSNMHRAHKDHSCVHMCILVYFLVWAARVFNGKINPMFFFFKHINT